MEKSDKWEKVNQFISTGKEKGYLTYEEINKALPPKKISPCQIDEIIKIFIETDIEIVDSSLKK